MRYYKNRREQHKLLVEYEKWETHTDKEYYMGGYKALPRRRQLIKAMLGVI